MPDRVGQQIGPYRLIQLLGKGGFAEVYKGQHIHLNTFAAVKVLLTQLTGNEVNKFRNEARNLAQLIHPNIVRVLDFDVYGETPFLIMDFAPNGTLRTRHPTGTRVPMATFMPYVKQMASALDFAHSHNIIHRDVKPENMLVGRQNEVLLSDFGIAKNTQNSQSVYSQTVVGTTAYMAPEQIQANPCPATDQYALGIIVYEWLCGDRPFHGSFLEITAQHIHAQPPSLVQRIQGLPPSIEQVVMKALTKDPLLRFRTTTDFANALEQAWRTPNQPIILPPQSNPGPYRVAMPQQQPQAFAPPRSAYPQQPIRSTQPQQIQSMQPQQQPARSAQPQQVQQQPVRSTQLQQPQQPQQPQQVQQPQQQPAMPQWQPVITPPNPNLPVTSVPALPRPSTAHISWPTFSLSLSERQAIGNGNVPQERLTISGQIAKTQPGLLPVTGTQPLVTVPLVFFQQPPKPSVVIDLANTPPKVASTSGIVRTTGAMTPVKSSSAGTKSSSGGGMQIVRSSGTSGSSGANVPAKTTSKPAAASPSTTQEDGRKLSKAALVIAFISVVAILPTTSIVSSPPFHTYPSTINGDAAVIFIGAFIAFIMGCVGNARGNRAGIGASRAAGWSIALSVIITIVEIVLLVVLYSHTGTYNIY